MAGLVVVDTDLVIDFLRGRGEGAPLVRHLLSAHRLRFTAVTAFEVRLGSDFLDRKDAIMRLFRSRTLPLDLSSGLIAGRVHAALLGDGKAIGLADALQAGICLRHELPFATRNRKHFQRVTGLRLVDLDEMS
jgi:tRNA(fMet)-specific endonuclease VapC